MSRMTAQECFDVYRAVKIHFTSDYNYNQYYGKLTFLNVDTRNDRFHFHRLVRMIDGNDMLDFFVANAIFRNTPWIGDLVDDTALDNFTAYKKYFESLSYFFRLDLDKLFETQYTDPNDIFRSKGGQYPPIVQKALSGDISILTFAVIEDILSFCKVINKKISDDILWPKIYRTTIKVKSFFEYDKEKITEILREYK